MEIQANTVLLGCVINISSLDLDDQLEIVKAAGFKINEEFKCKTGYSVTVGIGSIVSGIENIRQSYNVCSKYTEAKLILGKNRVIDGSDIKTKKIRTVILDSKLEKVITDCIEKCEKSVMDEIVDRIHRRLKAGGIDIEDIKDFNYHFVELVYRVLNSMGINSADFLPPQVTCEELDVSEDFEELMGKIRRILDSSLQAVSCSDTNYYKKLFTDIKRYIAMHYMQDISRESVAEEFTFNPNYFSRLFKEETGQNFIDYLTDYRIKVARELLKDMRNNIFDIAKMVGYPDAKYFTKVFKKVVGITPKEYIGKCKE